MSYLFLKHTHTYVYIYKFTFRNKVNENENVWKPQKTATEQTGGLLSKHTLWRSVHKTTETLAVAQSPVCGRETAVTQTLFKKRLFSQKKQEQETGTTNKYVSRFVELEVTVGQSSCATTCGHSVTWLLIHIVLLGLPAAWLRRRTLLTLQAPRILGQSPCELTVRWRIPSDPHI